jgi:heme A synthase
MRRGTLKSRLARIALAYVLALQGVLGAWAVHTAAASTPTDPSLTLCRIIANADTQPSSDDAARGLHCVAMCLSGACSAGDPPATVSTEAEFSGARTTAISILFGRDHLRPTELLVPPNARGPPSIV